MPELFYQASPEVSTRVIGNKGALIYHPDKNREEVINATGLFVWRRLDGSRSRNELADEIRRNFRTNPSMPVQDDLQSFLDALSREGYAQALAEQRASSGIIRKFPSRDDGPKKLDISLTGKCNLHCRYCFYADEMQSRKDLPVKQWLLFIEELGDLAVRDVCLSGGEIFTRRDLWKFIDGLISQRMRYSILTNGTLITKKTIEFFEEGQRRQRLSSIQVSIDGSCPEVHDSSRGKGSFNRAVRGLRLLKEAGFPVTVRATVSRHNIDDLEELSHFLLTEIGLTSFSTNDAVPMGSGCLNKDSIALTPEQKAKAMTKLAGLAENYDGRITAQAGPLANWHFYKDMEKARSAGKKSDKRKMGYLTACGCVFDKLAVHHDGVITPCNMLPGLEMGKINVDSISKLWKTHPTLKALKDRRKIPMDQVSGCEDCEWSLYCNGSCPAPAYELTGELNRANLHDCYRKFLKEAGNVINQ